jgi:glycosyltransferase involved in cell wall biosynthesis
MELVVFDDASDASLADGYQRTLERISHFEVSYMRSLVNRGVSHARNRAIEATDSDIIVPLDADDLLHPKALEWLVTTLEHDSTAALAYSDNLKFTWPELSLYQYRIKATYHRHLRYYKNTIYDPLYQSTFVVGAQAYTRESYTNAGKYDETIEAGEDVKFLLDVHELSDRQNFAYVPYVLYYRRHDPQGLSRSKQNEMHETTAKIFHNRLQRVDDEITAVDYDGRFEPYGVSHYSIKRGDGSRVRPPYVREGDRSLSDPVTQAKLATYWRKFHKPAVSRLEQNIDGAERLS